MAVTTDQPQQEHETKILYHLDDEDTPYLIKLPISPDVITLRDFKQHIFLPKSSYKFFFKSTDEDMEIVKEEITDDDARLPMFKGRVVSYIVSADGSNVSDSSQSQVTEISGGHNHRRAHGRDRYADASSVTDTCDTTSCTETETDSMISSRRGHRYGKHDHRRHHRCDYDTSTVMTSDIDSTSYVDSGDDDESVSRVSTTTDETSVSRVHASRHRRRRRRHRMPSLSRTSSVSSVTDSFMSLNVITVTLNLDAVSFLGISIIGRSHKTGDAGIFVSRIMKGGAVALDGRIEVGDMLLQVNDVNFENVTNDEAVRILREAVQKPGPIRLVVGKLGCWNQNQQSYFTIPSSEPVRPIDPGAWVAHTEAAQGKCMFMARVSLGLD